MRQNVSHYAAKCIALCGKTGGRFAAKTRCIMRQNTMHYAGKIVSSYFCIITKNKKRTEKFV
jgi:hypothetical protein